MKLKRSEEHLTEEELEEKRKKNESILRAGKNAGLIGTGAGVGLYGLGKFYDKLSKNGVDKVEKARGTTQMATKSSRRLKTTGAVLATTGAALHGISAVKYRKSRKDREREKEETKNDETKS